MFKVVFYTSEEDAMPISQIVEADDNQSAEYEILYIYPNAKIVNVFQL